MFGGDDFYEGSSQCQFEDWRIYKFTNHQKNVVIGFLWFSNHADVADCLNNEKT